MTHPISLFIAKCSKSFTKITITTTIIITCPFEDEDLVLDPPVAGEIVGDVFCLVFDCHAVDEPIAVKPTPITLEHHHQKLPNVLSGHVVVISFAGFKVIVEPLIQ